MTQLTDIHSHLLAEVDDGADSMEESCMMADIAFKNGTRSLVLTPHSNIPGGYQNHWGEDLFRRFEQFKAALFALRIGLNLMMGMEIYGSADAACRLQEGHCLTLNGSRYALIEFAPGDRVHRVEEVLSEVAELGLVPVIAHPERYRFVQEKPELAEAWLRRGWLLQTDKGSIAGSFGRQAFFCALELLDRRLVHAVASDSHSPYRRTPSLAETWEYLSERYSPARADLLLSTIPGMIVANQSVKGYIQ